MAQIIDVLVGLAMAAIWPAVVSLAIVFAARAFLPARFQSGSVLILAFAVAYSLGHALSAGTGFTLRPTRNWQWMFYLTPLAGLTGAISSSPKATWRQHCLLIALLSGLAASLLAGKPTLSAPRALGYLALFAYFMVVWATLEPLANRVSAAALAGAFAIAATALCLMISEQISLSDGVILAAAAAALASVSIGAWVSKFPARAAGLSIPFAITLGGWAWIETLSIARLWPLLLVPLAPAALWITQLAPVRSRRGFAAVAIPTAAVIAVLVLTGILLRMGATEQFE